jgi:hypothetical protein
MSAHIHFLGAAQYLFANLNLKPAKRFKTEKGELSNHVAMDLLEFLTNKII